MKNHCKIVGIWLWAIWLSEKAFKFWPPLLPSDFSEDQKYENGWLFVFPWLYTQKSFFNYFSHKTWKEQFFSLSSSKISKWFWNQMFGCLYIFLLMQCMSMRNKFDKKYIFIMRHAGLLHSWIKAHLRPYIGPYMYA